VRIDRAWYPATISCPTPQELPLGTSVKQIEYALVTPARNEESFIAKTIESVLSQTILPRRWVIVSDGSTDRTDEIVATYSQRHSFIQLLRAGVPAGNKKKDFGSKVMAFRAGYDLLRGVAYDFVGNLDADITFAPQYHEQILEKFHASPALGVAGGIVLEPYRNRFVPQNTSLNSVCGSVQLFRRACYESFGGYVPLRRGGVDAAAEIMARMHGWTVQTFPEIQVHSQRPVSTGGATIYHTRFRQGMSNRLLGYHPLFQIVSSLSRLADRPFVVGSACTLLGFAWGYCLVRTPALPDEVVKFLHSEQMARIASHLRHDDRSNSVRRTH
jgi:biofilm PGA synthesis N-glycosyltransferase PgaC